MAGDAPAPVRSRRGRPDPEDGTPAQRHRQRARLVQRQGELQREHARLAEELADVTLQLARHDAAEAAGGPEVWRDWGNRFGQGLPAEVLEKIAGTVAELNLTEAGWEAGSGLRKEVIQRALDEYDRKSLDQLNLISAVDMALVCKGWAEQLKVTGPPRTLAEVARWHRAEVGFCGAEWSETCAKAAADGHLEILQWLRANGWDWDELTCNLAAFNGHLNVLRWAHENGCPWDAETCEQAAMGGHFEVLKWLRANGCPWDFRTCDSACHDEKILPWARKRGCAMSSVAYEQARWFDGYTDNYGNLI